MKIYADMVSADRELRLAGYEVYRFGANELVGEGAEARIADFSKSSFDCIASCSEVPPSHIKRAELGSNTAAPHRVDFRRFAFGRH